MTFEVVKISFFQKVPLVPFKWMKVDEWDYCFLFSLFSFNFDLLFQIWIHCQLKSLIFWLFTSKSKQCVMILTCCIIFQFESSCSIFWIRIKMKEELVAGRDLARWQGITTIWISQHGWCIWITIINSQWIIAENVDFYFCWCYNEKTLKLTNCKYQNVENWIESIVQLTVEHSRYNLFHFHRVEDIQVM